MNKFKRSFANWEKAEKALHQAQKALDEQLITTAAHKKAVQTAMKAVQTAYNQANVAMQHYDNAQFLLLQSKDAITYFDEQGNRISHQQQADQCEAMLCQHTCTQRVQVMLQNLQSLLTKSNRSSSMIETANSCLKPFLRAARGQISQERLNLIRRYLNHCPYERSRVADRKGFSPYQLFLPKKRG
ncbi:MAG TPA: hypothetical protein PK239_09280 [Chitinophagales bacterium]|nr:hypothetical protein [Chitinophagales bacterium]